MPINALVFFLASKYNDEAKRDAYLYDALWAMATDMRFKDKNNKATLSRWQEINGQIGKPKQQDLSAEEILNIMLRR